MEPQTEAQRSMHVNNVCSGHREKQVEETCEDFKKPQTESQRSMRVNNVRSGYLRFTATRHY